MPIHTAPDVKRALGGDALPECVSRSLLQGSFVFRSDTLADKKQIALALLLRDRGAALGIIEKRYRAEMEKQHARANDRRNTPVGREQASARETAARIGVEELRPFLNRTADPEAFACSRAWLKPVSEAHRCTFHLTTAEPLIVGLTEGPLENAGVQLDRHLGVPYLAGSSLKGLALDGVALVPKAAPEQERIFGNTVGTDDASKGQVSFLAAYPDDDAELVLELCTPHYKGYYDRSENPEALDKEQPTIAPFPAVARATRFRFDLLLLNPNVDEASAKALLGLAQQCLTAALTNWGAGSRTRAGYGRFVVEHTPQAWLACDLFPVALPEAPPPPPPPREMTPLEAFVARWPAERIVPMQAAALASDLADLSDDALLRQAFESVMPEKLRGRMTTFLPFWDSFQKARYRDNPQRRPGVEVLQRLSLVLSR